MGKCKKPPRGKPQTSLKGSIDWERYPGDNETGFGNGKLCYFLSCPDSELPIRDYIHAEKGEPHYEDKSYNACASCNQNGIKNAKSRGISFLIFYTKYAGKRKEPKDKYFITGLFPISRWGEVRDEKGKRNAYQSEEPIFLSIEDSKLLDDETWKNWFGKRMPNHQGSHNLRWMTNFLKKDSPAMRDILQHFHEHKKDNRINDYIKELKR